MSRNDYKLLTAQEFNELLYKNFMNNSIFYFPKISNNLKEVLFYVSANGFYLNSSTTQSSLSFYTHCWLIMQRKTNPKLFHYTIYLMMNHLNPISDFEKKLYMLHYFRSDELPTIFSNPDLLDFFYRRCIGRVTLIKRYLKVAPSLYAQFNFEAVEYMKNPSDSDYPLVNHFLRKVNKLFPETIEIKDFQDLSEHDLYDIITRDYLTNKYVKRNS